ncbi:hypothetical protein OPV22_010496 [Ensete ventricosum]|uniref:DUF4005 domain-containing protein n=1 Tax=Ensete ventricosum TaxID=4639 RepID=A0AAV8PVU6_ENSVE|nr:hypothetical protein OPV22_010496 [Ensete ventricosum]
MHSLTPTNSLEAAFSFSFSFLSMEEPSSNERLLSQLVLHVPLVSTRRSSSSSTSTNSVDRSGSTRRRVPSSDLASQRVPFSWESSPGVPKLSRATRPRLDEFDVEPLPLPPKLCPSGEDNHANALARNPNDDEADVRSSSDDDDDDDDVFSDALDKMSLSGRLDIACRLSSFNDLASSDIERRRVHRSPSFIMNRFLPAAAALANSSLRNDVHFSRRAVPSSSYHLQKEFIRARAKPGASTRRLQAPFDPHEENGRDMPSMACGLLLFFPWSFKPTVCGFKSPAQSRTPGPHLAASPNTVVDRCINGRSSDSVNPTVCGFMISPARNRKPRPDLASPPKRIVCSSSDGWSCDAEDNGGGYADKLSTKVSHSHGWGLPFLDTSRLRTRGRDIQRWKDKAARMGFGGCQRDQNKRNEAVPDGRRSIWRLPQLTSPSESWLSHALSSINRRQ